MAKTVASRIAFIIQSDEPAREGPERQNMQKVGVRGCSTHGPATHTDEHLTSQPVWPIGLPGCELQTVQRCQGLTGVT